MLSPIVFVTKTPGYVPTDTTTSPDDTIKLFPVDIGPELRGAMLAILQDYQQLIDMPCTTPFPQELGKRRIRGALSAAVKGLFNVARGIRRPE